MYARHNLTGRDGNGKSVREIERENPLPADAIRRSTRRAR